MPRKKRRKKVEENKLKLEMTSMIDVVFNLLIFFLCSPFKIPEGELDAFLPKDIGLQSIKTETPDIIPVTINLKEGRGGKPKIYIGRIVLESNSDGEPRFDRLSDWLVDYKAAQGPPVVQIKSDEKVKYKYVISALNACTRAEITDIRFTLPLGPLEAKAKPR